MVGTGRGAGRGILIKGGEALEMAYRIDTIVLDKTGTLTQGKPRVMQVTPAAGFTENEVLALAASAERYSEHPLGKAIVEAAQGGGLHWMRSPVSRRRRAWACAPWWRAPGGGVKARRHRHGGWSSGRLYRDRRPDQTGSGRRGAAPARPAPGSLDDYRRQPRHRRFHRARSWNRTRFGRSNARSKNWPK